MALGRIPPPRARPGVRYFRLAYSGERADFTDHRLMDGFHRWGSQIVNIRADLTPAEARRTAVHEVAHAVGGKDDPGAEEFCRASGL